MFTTVTASQVLHEGVDEKAVDLILLNIVLALP
jgi:hypothetical protein